MGATAIGHDLFTATTTPNARATLGGGAVGSQLFTAPDLPTAWNDLGLTATSTLPISVGGSAGSVAASGITGFVTIVQGGTSSQTASGALDPLLVAGTYNWGKVDTDGRVLTANDVSTSTGITDGVGDQLWASSTPAAGLFFMTGSVIRMVLDNSGQLGIGTETPQERRCERTTSDREGQQRQHPHFQCGKLKPRIAIRHRHRRRIGQQALDRHDNQHAGKFQHQSL